MMAQRGRDTDFKVLTHERCIVLIDGFIGTVLVPSVYSAH